MLSNFLPFSVAFTFPFYKHLLSFSSTHVYCSIIQSSGIIFGLYAGDFLNNEIKGEGKLVMCATVPSLPGYSCEIPARVGVLIGAEKASRDLVRFFIKNNNDKTHTNQTSVIWYEEKHEGIKIYIMQWCNINHDCIDSFSFVVVSKEYLYTATIKYEIILQICVEVADQFCGIVLSLKSTFIQLL